MKFLKRLLAFILMLPLVTLLGCTAGHLIEIGPSSNFIPPNSNVTALGPVSVKRSGNVALMPNIKTGEDDLAMYNEAMAQVPGADTVIDYTRVTKIKFIPYPVPLYWTNTTFEGTAAKVVVGEKEIE